MGIVGVGYMTTGGYETHHLIFRYPSAIPLPSYPRVPAYGHRSHRAPRKGGGLLIGYLWYVSPSRSAIAIPEPYRIPPPWCLLAIAFGILHNGLDAYCKRSCKSLANRHLNATK